MNKDRFDFVCMEAEQGRDAFVRHPDSGEEGRVVGCSGEQVLAENTRGERRTWAFQALDQIWRSKAEWPRR